MLMVYCHKCGNEVADEDHFCSKCGARTAKGKDSGVSAPAEELRESLSRMGEEMEKAFSSAAKEIHDAFRTAGENVRGAAGNEPVICPSCGQKNASGANYCHKCGQKIGTK
jgi:uncharacterized membrane protein YvbJ